MNVIDQIRDGIERVGWSETARRTGQDRTHLHRAFGRNGRKRPTLETIERVLPALGLELVVQEASR